MKPKTNCPHCGARIEIAKLPHQGLIQSLRECPHCHGLFQVDPDTRRRQAAFILIALVSLVLTALLYTQGVRWLWPACASYALLGGLIFWANGKVYLVAADSDREIDAR